MKKVLYGMCLLVLGIVMFREIRQVDKRGTNVKKITERPCYRATDELMEKIEKENSRKVAYLTFDDGPSENTKKVLKVLEEKNAVATFFLVGNKITDETEEIVKETVENKNAVGVHTYSHEKNELYASERDFWNDYKMASDNIEKITDKTPTLHRFPWGSNNGYVTPFVDQLLVELKKEGIRSFDWNVSGEDSVGIVTKQSIMKNIKKDLNRFEYPIILLHDSATADVTVEVLGEIIDYVRAQGYEFDTLEYRDEYVFPSSWR